MRVSQDTFFPVLVKALLLTTVALDPVVNFLKVELEQTAALHGRYPPLTCPLIDGVFADIQHVGNFLNTDKSSFDLHCIRALSSWPWYPSRQDLKSPIFGL